MPERSCLAIILAAGEGTRMRSTLPKALHKIGGLPLVGHVLEATRSAAVTRVAVVTGPDRDVLAAEVSTLAPNAATYVQAERLGTAHAVLAAKREFAAGYDDVLVLYGDTPLIAGKTLARMRRTLARGADLVVLGFKPADPTGYGRLIVDGKRLVAIHEDKDATPAERMIDFCNAGAMAFAGRTIPPLLKKIGNQNAKDEYYLTDLVELAAAAGLEVTAIEADAEEVVGVNTRRELAAAENLFQAKARATAMAGGATLIDPDTVYFSFDTRLGKDVVVEPNVYFGPGVTVADRVSIRAFCHIEGARIATGAIVGPFAHLRPGADIGANAHIGNFVEVKNANIGEGAKANHLSYIGDADIGAKVNVGAGAITCNYDGFNKYRTEVGSGTFIGSNSSLVAPVRIGDNAYVATGSVITKDIAPGALAIARERQVEKPGWAKRFAALKTVGKKKKA